jgi:putative endonuclease
MWLWLRRLLSAGTFGDRGERLAERHLRSLGYRILARNVRNSGGEIDLIARDGDTVVFVEVKSRRDVDHGRPEDAVSRDKQSRLTRAALVHLKSRGWLERRARFDVVAIVWPADGEPQVTHFKCAFEPTGRGQMFS